MFIWKSIRAALNVISKLQLWRQFQEIIAEDQPYCFTVIKTRVWFINNRLGNQYFAKLRPQDWFYPWFVKETK